MRRAGSRSASRPLREPQVREEDEAAGVVPLEKHRPRARTPVGGGGRHDHRVGLDDSFLERSREPAVELDERVRGQVGLGEPRLAVRAPQRLHVDASWQAVERSPSHLPIVAQATYG